MTFNTSRLHNTANIELYTAQQVYDIEKNWFEAGNNSYGLMQQAAWLSAKWIYNNQVAFKCKEDGSLNDINLNNQLSACIWVGGGNNGGDGWLIAEYLSALKVDVIVIEVSEPYTNDAKSAKNSALKSGVNHISLITEHDINSDSDITATHFDKDVEPTKDSAQNNGEATLHQLIDTLKPIDVFVDALFGIGLDRAPIGKYAQAIRCINKIVASGQHQSLKRVVAIDVPSGLVASTGRTFDNCAVKADFTLCMVARKIGLHINDGNDFVGEVVDISLIPTVLNQKPIATLATGIYPLSSRRHNTHKGSFGHALIVGGNQIKGSQGMGGAAILAAESAFAVGVGKLTVACHSLFHNSLITNLPNAMCLDLHDSEGVDNLIIECDVIAIGMGLGRDRQSSVLFERYVNKAIDTQTSIVIDADGLYHLTTSNPSFKSKLIEYSKHQKVWYTPHSAEAARLLSVKVKDIENDRIKAIKQLSNKFKGSWLLKGTGSIVSEQNEIWICNRGNAGMATAGMGDVLSGVCAGLMAQSHLSKDLCSLQQAVVIHAIAGDELCHSIGESALQAAHMPKSIGIVMKQITRSYF